MPEMFVVNVRKTLPGNGDFYVSSELFKPISFWPDGFRIAPPVDIYPELERGRHFRL